MTQTHIPQLGNKAGISVAWSGIKMAMAIRSATVCTVVLALAGCAGSHVSSVGPRDVRPTSAKNIRGPYVPARTRFTVRIDQAIDTGKNNAGQPVTGKLMEPLRATDGTLVSPAGARIYGELASVGKPPNPQVRLRIERIDTVAGPVPVWITVRRVEHITYPGRLYLRRTPEPFDPISSTYYSVRPHDLMGPWTMGGGPTSRDPALQTGSYRANPNTRGSFQYAHEILIPAGALLEVELARLLPAPGATVVNR